MKVTSKVEVRELPFEILRNTCPKCGAVEDIDIEEMSEVVTKDVVLRLIGLTPHVEPFVTVESRL